jgi:hypothetical protein
MSFGPVGSSICGYLHDHLAEARRGILLRLPA